MNQTYPCRSCGNTPGQRVLDLGIQPLANNLLSPEDTHKIEPRFPLGVFVCPRCWLLQITDLVPPVTLFSHYVYFSSFSDALLAHARKAAERYAAEYKLDKQSFVLEIASNDGYLLQNFVRMGVPCLGIEPAANIAAEAKKKGVESLLEFFGKRVASQLAGEGRQADLILGNNVFAHAPDINDFVAGLAAALKPKGRIVLEFPYAVDLIDKVEFDTVYHEHVFYFTLTALVAVFQRHALEIIEVERLEIHGGSLRLFAAHKGAHPAGASVREILADERRKEVNTISFYETFSKRVQDLKSDLLTLLNDLKSQRKRIAAYGASAKGSTLLNYVGVGPETIEFMADRSTYKQGKLSPGMHIPIVGPEALRREKPDYTLLLTWNFASEVLQQQKDYVAAGGKFIVPIPRVRVL